MAAERYNGISAKQLWYDYDAEGHPTQITSSLFSEGIAYKSNGYGGSGYYDGSIASTGFSYWTGGPSGYNVSYQYNDHGKLTVADNTLDNTKDITNIAYDNNGNIQSLTMGGTAKTYAYYSSTNRLKNTAGASNDYQYDSNGNVTISSPKNIPSVSYDPFTQMPAQMTKNGTSDQHLLKFEYQQDNERVMKKDFLQAAQTTTWTLYVRGMNEYPIFERVKDDEGGTTDKRYIYGPTGLIAMKTSTATYYVIKDHLGSVRVLFDVGTGSAVAAYDYQTYGSLLRSWINTDSRYRFTGQEYDFESDMWNFRARLYDSDVGIFYGADPILNNSFNAPNKPVAYRNQ